jgi:hypothetical protein
LRRFSGALAQIPDCICTRNDKSPALAGLSQCRRGLEPPPGYPGPGPQPGNASVRCVQTALDRPDRRAAWTSWTHRTIWMLPRMLPRPRPCSRRRSIVRCARSAMLASAGEATVAHRARETTAGRAKRVCRLQPRLGELTGGMRLQVAASCVTVNPRGNSKSASGFPRVSAMMRSRTLSSSLNRTAELSSLRASPLRTPCISSFERC